MVAVDLVDSFYLFFYLLVAELFAFGPTFRANDLNLDGYYDARGEWRPSLAHPPIFAGLAMLPMRWCWALHFGHNVRAQVMVIAAERAFGLCGSDALRLLLVAGRPPPSVRI